MQKKQPTGGCRGWSRYRKKSPPDTRTSSGNVPIRDLPGNIRVSLRGIFPVRILPYPGMIDEEVSGSLRVPVDRM